MENQLPVYCPCCGHIRTVMKSEFPIAKCEFCETTFLQLEDYTSTEMLRDILHDRWKEKERAIQNMLIKPSIEFRQEQWDKRLELQAQESMGSEGQKLGEDGEPICVPKCPICGSVDLKRNGSYGFQTGRMYQCKSCDARF